VECTDLVGGQAEEQGKLIHTSLEKKEKREIQIAVSFRRVGRRKKGKLRDHNNYDNSRAQRNPIRQEANKKTKWRLVTLDRITMGRKKKKIADLFQNRKSIEGKRGEMKKKIPRYGR